MSPKYLKEFAGAGAYYIDMFSYMYLKRYAGHGLYAEVGKVRYGPSTYVLKLVTV
jgi:hypothetical protein